MPTLWVAAGGGGDVIAASLMARLVEGDPAAPILTWSWDRLALDPAPGPRGPSEFAGLEAIGTANRRVRPGASLRGSGESSVAILASALRNDLYLVDPLGGARGVRRQVAELADILSADRVVVVDVGGDIVARGDEQGLRSPLADVLLLAAVRDLDVPADVIVVGAGLDGELPESEVLALTEGARSVGTLPPTLAGSYVGLVECIPSDANTLLLAAATGLQGRAEVRDSGQTVVLSDESVRYRIVSSEDVVRGSRLVPAVAESDTLAAAEEGLVRLGLPSEIAYERRKAERLEGTPLRGKVDEVEVLPSLDAYSDDAAGRGIDFLTLRRVGEVLGLSWGGSRSLAELLHQRWPERYRHGVWSVHRSNGGPQMQVSSPDKDEFLAR